jgi:hypothetical protein
MPRSCLTGFNCWSMFLEKINWWQITLKPLVAIYVTDKIYTVNWFKLLNKNYHIIRSCTYASLKMSMFVFPDTIVRFYLETFVILTCCIVNSKKAQKSDNLQYNMLVGWFAWTNDSSTKGLMFQVLVTLLFMISYRLIGHSKLFNFMFVKQLKRFLQRILHEIMKKE